MVLCVISAFWAHYITLSGLLDGQHGPTAARYKARGGCEPQMQSKVIKAEDVEYDGRREAGGQSRFARTPDSRDKRGGKHQGSDC